MYKFLITTICLWLFSVSLLGQNQKQDSVYKLAKTFENLSYTDFKFEINYIKEKETLYFKILKNNRLHKAYQLLLKDIHPKGIFIYKYEDVSTIRILSINNGHVFIEEEFKNGFRVSNTTNYIDIGSWGKEYDNTLSNFVVELEKFIKEKSPKKKKTSKEIEIIVAPPNKE